MFTSSLVFVNSLSHTGEVILQVHRQKNFKQELIQSAARLFCLSETQKEELANKAGLSLQSDKNFTVKFRQIIKQSTKSCREIYEEAQVSERMFYLIKSGRIPTKTTLISLAITLDLDIEEIENLLKKAGYVLSKSIEFDLIIRWLITNNRHKHNRIVEINEILNKLELPLLMTKGNL
jgi:hypothetical protein